MSDEITVRSSLQIVRTSSDGKVIQQHITQPGQFTASMTGVGGPSPGSFLATTEGVDVDLSNLDDPGMCEVTNYDQTNYVQMGIFDPQTNKFYPLVKIGPLAQYVFELAEDLLEEFEGTGTGTSAATNTLRVKAHGDDCVVCVNAFER